MDNLVYRFGFSPSRRFAKQLVSHKHILVDGKIVNILSYLISPSQVVSLDTKALSMTSVKTMLGKKDYVLPSWLERKAAVGKFSRFPRREEMDININEQLIVEHYSR